MVIRHNFMINNFHLNNPLSSRQFDLIYCWSGFIIQIVWRQIKHAALSFNFKLFVFVYCLLYDLISCIRVEKVVMNHWLLRFLLLNPFQVYHWISVLMNSYLFTVICHCLNWIWNECFLKLIFRIRNLCCCWNVNDWKTARGCLFGLFDHLIEIYGSLFCKLFVTWIVLDWFKTIKRATSNFVWLPAQVSIVLFLFEQCWSLHSHRVWKAFQFLVKHTLSPLLSLTLLPDCLVKICVLPFRQQFDLLLEVTISWVVLFLHFCLNSFSHALGSVVVNEINIFIKHTDILLNVKILVLFASSFIFKQFVWLCIYDTDPCSLRLIPSHVCYEYYYN